MISQIPRLLPRLGVIPLGVPQPLGFLIPLNLCVLSVWLWASSRAGGPGPWG